MDDLKVRISRYMSYLLRHNPENLKMDREGFVNFEELYSKIREKFKVDKDLIFELVEKSERKRFEIVNGKIRALYGHSIPVNLGLKEDETVKVLYHGTTMKAAKEILKNGLKKMGRRWVHLSPTIEIAKKIGLRRTNKPVILEINVERARENGLKFYKATDKVYLTSCIPPKYIKLVHCEAKR
ncbi:RNA 2'-phosphotransferase [Candidatus Bathyarchaeota archaeon]|nr:RNA 2'-phosphotransferase [Candidatus Bathyarchaeota archaeon]